MGMAYRMMKDRMASTIKAVGKLWKPALAVISPPIYFVQDSIRDGDYRDGGGSAIGSAIGTAMIAGCCFVGGYMMDTPIWVLSEERDIISKQRIVSESRDLEVTQGEYAYPDAGLLIRKFLFPLEGWARHLLADNYPRSESTKVSGVVNRGGLEVEIEATIPELRDAETITDADLVRYSSKAKVRPESYKALYGAE